MDASINIFNHIAITPDIDAILVSVIYISGSTPREVGAKMLVYNDHIIATIGGGKLEFKAVELSRKLLNDGDEKTMIRKYTLGPSLGQCCGGVVTILFEPLISSGERIKHFKQLNDIIKNGGNAISIIDLKSSASRMILSDNITPLDLDSKIVVIANDLLKSNVNSCNMVNIDNEANNQGGYLIESICHYKIPLYIYGAGHVAKSLMHILLTLDFDIYWVDQRRDEFPQNTAQMPLTPYMGQDAIAIAKLSKPRAFHIILTHDHQIDFDICQILLRQNNHIYLGLIGSGTKCSSFINRFKKNGISSSAIDNFTCPIGIGNINSKKPAEIAIAVAAEIIEIKSNIQQTIV